MMAKNNSINNASGYLEIDPGSSGDSYVQFSINSIGEWRVGCDDTDSDAFVISQGSALGTNNRWRMSANGEMTMPLQPAFYAKLATGETISNGTGDGTTINPVIYPTELFDQGGDYNAATGVFTAPVTGRYWLEATIFAQQLTTSHTDLQFTVITSNRNAPIIRINAGNVGSANASVPANALIYNQGVGRVIDMDASDTASVSITISGGTKVVDLLGSNLNNVNTFGGYLIC